jgi:hypothetical protein
MSDKINLTNAGNQGIKPLSREAIYPSGTLDIIKDVKMGRPKKQPESKES